ncbi:MAG: hypothetical protein AAB834_05450, partial [Patescibacteria group bacterium]
MEKTNTIHGKIVSKLGDTTSGLIVRAYSVGIRREELLGETVADENGDYTITWGNPLTANRQQTVVNIGLKVLAPVKKAVLFNSGPDDIRINASRREEINVVLTEPIKPEVIDYEDIIARLSARTGDLPIVELEETDQHHDIALLAKNTRIPAGKIEHLVLAQRLEQLSHIEAPFFYALLRKNTLLKSDLGKPFQMRLFIDSNSDPKGVLYD